MSNKHASASSYIKLTTQLIGKEKKVLNTYYSDQPKDSKKERNKDYSRINNKP